MMLSAFEHTMFFLALVVYVSINRCSVIGQQPAPPLCNGSSFRDIDFNKCSVVGITFESDSVLNESLILTDVQEITLQGGRNGLTEISCTKGSGLNFTRVCNLNIRNLQFDNCGHFHMCHLCGFADYAIFIDSSINVNIHGTRITNAVGTGLILTNSKIVNITNSSFNDNQFDTDVSVGGGGMYISIECSQYSTDCLQYHYTIYSCNFTNNLASNNLSIADGIGKGGGLALRITNATSNVYINDSIFQNNSAIWGGGLQIIVSEGSHDNYIRLENSKIDSNSVTWNGGGGINIGYIGNLVTNNHISLYLVNISNNNAMFGGGTAVFSHAFNQSGNTIIFTDCHWLGNIANYGSAVNVSPHPLIVITEVKESMLKFIDCTFESNQVVDKVVNSSVSRSGEGIIMVTNSIITFNGRIKFFDNNSTCIHAISSILFFNFTKTLFMKNTARDGAGISLIGFSVIVANENNTITFCNNSVFYRGDAINLYSIDKLAYVSEQTCFFQKYASSQSPDGVYFNFFGNHALSDPIYVNSTKKTDSIYGNSFSSCCNSCGSNYEFYKVGTFRQCDVCTDSMLSDSDNVSCDPAFSRPKISTMERDINLELENGKDLFKFIPGKKFDIPWNKDFSNKIKAFYYVSIRNINNSNITIPDYFSVASRHLQLRGKPGNSGIVTLTEVGFRKYSVSFKVEANDCPPLYKINENFTCECYSSEDTTFVEFNKCYDNYRAGIRLGYWISLIRIEDTEQNRSDRFALLNSYCPLGYCSNNVNDDNYHELPDSSFDDIICNSRHGTLCGECDSNTSVFFHSETYKCGSTHLCYLGPLIYLLSEILPLTVLFIFIIFFDISFTSGNLNGFIFFAQMYHTISRVGENFIPPSSQYSKFSYLHRFVYKLFNINFFEIDGLSFCLFKTQSTLNILLIKYLSVGYALILVVGTIWLVRCFSNIRCLRIKKSKYSVVQGLSAFLVMVYSQCTYISVSILNPIVIYKDAEAYKKVVFYQGTIKYFHPNHLPYAIPALLCILLFVAPVPLLLIAYPLCNRIIGFLGMEENRFVKLTSRLIPITKFKPLLDSFQGTFKDDYRFFAGLYFVYRVLVLLSRFATGAILIFSIIEVQLIAMLAVHTMVWPYQKKIHNVIDLVVFANLAIINSLKLLNFFYAESGVKLKRQIRTIQWFQLFFIYIPLAGIVLWVLYLLFCKLRSVIKKQRVSRNASFLSEQRSVEAIVDDDSDFLENEPRFFLASENYKLMKRKQLHNVANL